MKTLFWTELGFRLAGMSELSFFRLKCFCYLRDSTEAFESVFLSIHFLTELSFNLSSGDFHFQLSIIHFSIESCP